MNCAECTHYHDLGDKLMCDTGLMEVTMVGNPQVVVKMQQCEKFDSKEQRDFIIQWNLDEPKRQAEKLDKRTKEYKEKHK